MSVIGFAVDPGEKLVGSMGADLGNDAAVGQQSQQGKQNPQHDAAQNGTGRM